MVKLDRYTDKYGEIRFIKRPIKYLRRVLHGFHVRHIKSLGRVLHRFRVMLPYILKDSDWDYEGIYDIIAVKLRILHKAIKEDFLQHVGVEKDLRRIKEAIRICEILGNSFDYNDPFDRYTEKYGEKPYTTHFIPAKGHPDCSELIFTYHKGKFTKSYLNSLYKERETALTNFRERLGHLLTNNIYRWWS